jgi:uncharacterized protein
MSEDWSKLRDIDPLADGRAQIPFAIGLAEFPRLASVLVRTEGRARGGVHFGRLAGSAVAEVQVDAELRLTCQRCLGALERPVHSRGRVALVSSPEEADRVPADLETLWAPERRVSIRDLVEEELLLALPLVAVHAAGECAGVADAGAAIEGPPAAERQRPFAGLDELLKR